MITPITAVAVPALSRLKDSPERYRQAYLRLLEKVALLTMPIMVFMIVSSDWLVAIVLGPKWAGVSPIFSLLGIAGLVQPLASTTGWLFVTQGRTQDMLRVGNDRSDYNCGRHRRRFEMGAIGVAASYSLTNLIIVIPVVLVCEPEGLCAWVISTVRLVPSLSHQYVRLVFCCFLKFSVSFKSSWTGLAVSFIVVVATTLAILVLLPQGRLRCWI